MCYTLRPSNLFAYIITQMECSRNEISYKELRNIRYKMESKDISIYVEITRYPLLEATIDFPDILKLEDTKVIFTQGIKNTQKKELEEYAKDIPEKYRKLLSDVINEMKS